MKKTPTRRYNRTSAEDGDRGASRRKIGGERSETGAYRRQIGGDYGGRSAKKRSAGVEKATGRRTYTIVLIAIIAVAVIAGVYLINYFTYSGKEEQSYNELTGYSNSESYTVNIEGDSKAADVAVHKQGYSFLDGAYYFDLTFADNYAVLANKDMSALNGQYPDMYAWLYIPGTNICYPVMYCEGEEYLYKNFKGEDAKSGSLFIQKKNTLDPLGKNVTIHGHNMKNGTMFGSLKAYWLESGMVGAKKVYLDTLYGNHVYELFSSYIEADTGNEYDFEFGSDEEYVSYLNELKGKTEVDFGCAHEFTAEDKLLTFSTCTQLNGAAETDRLIFHAYLVE